MQASFAKWVSTANGFLSEMASSSSNEAKATRAIELANHVLSLVTNETLRSPQDIIGEHIIPLQNSERFDTWFQSHPDFEGSRSVFDLLNGSSPALQAKLYWLKKRSNALMAGAVHFTPNWEDAEWSRNENYKVGIDFFLSPDATSIHIALSNLGKLRVLELSHRLTNTDIEVLQQWEKLPSAGDRGSLHSTLWDSFKLQSVNAKFYSGIADAFSTLHDHLVASGKKDQEAKMFASRLLGRLIFIWFIRKMRLINPDIEYFEPSGLDQGRYYSENLERLFFRTFNTPIGDRAIEADATLDLVTPYLSGGLFDPRADDWVGQGLDFPREYFTILFDHFSDFNFTTDESTPDYEQVAIDPEMLGRVFESLLATQVEETGEQARKSKGTFYTPREIVSFMCLEAVTSQLEQSADEDPRTLASIYKLLNTSDQDWATSSSNNLRDIPTHVRQWLTEKLSSIKTLDPACGSGAFPLGMLQLLTKLRLRLNPNLDAYGLKLEILQQNIFGVDIEPMAVEISRLRSWLSLIVEEKHRDQVEPLPNLEFNFVCANSLFALEGASLFTEPDIQSKLSKLRSQYFRATSPTDKRRIQQQYVGLAQPTLLDEFDVRGMQLKSFNPFDSENTASFFEPEVMYGFSHFDIVVGNPPYVRHEKISYKKNLNAYSIFRSTSDLYTYFYELGFNLLKPGGTLSYITSSKFGRALYGEALRSFLSTQTTVRSLVDFGVTHVFAAITNTWVLTFNKSAPKDNFLNVYLGISGSPVPYPQSKLGSGPWAFVDQSVSSLLEKIKNSGIEIGSSNLYKIYYGLKTGCNEGFVFDESIKDQLLASDPSNSKVIKPLLKGRDIGRYRLKEISSWIVATANGLDIAKDFPEIAKFLEQKDAQLQGRLRARSDKGSHWHNLRDCSYYLEMEAPKIVWLELSDRNKFAYSEDGEYILAGAWMLTGPNLKATLGVLNSKLISYYFNFVSNSSGMGTTQWKKFAVELLPLPDWTACNSDVVQNIESLVSKLEIDPEDLAAQFELDQKVFEIYGITDEESKLILGSI